MACCAELPARAESRARRVCLPGGESALQSPLPIVGVVGSGVPGVALMVHGCAIHSSPINRATIPVVIREVRDNAGRAKADMDSHLISLQESRHMGPIAISQRYPPPGGMSAFHSS